VTEPVGRLHGAVRSATATLHRTAARWRRRPPRDLDLGQVDTDGFTMVQLLDETDVRDVRAVVDAVIADNDAGFFASPAHAWGDEARRVDQVLKARLAGRLADLLPGYEPFMVAITSKPRHSSQQIKFHHDWTYTDERRHHPVFLWCPLVDCTAHSGALQVIPGSHLWSERIRPSRTLEATEHLQGELEPLAVELAFRAGDAVAFHPGTLHGSEPNSSPIDRPAITIALAPQDAQLVHFHLDQGGELSGFNVDESFFTLNPYGQPPAAADPIAPWSTALTEQDLRDALHDGARPEEAGR
jgi:hypothetical protein